MSLIAPGYQFADSFTRARRTRARSAAIRARLQQPFVTVEVARAASDGSLLHHFNHPNPSRMIADSTSRARRLFLKRAMVTGTFSLREDSSDSSEGIVWHRSPNDREARDFHRR